MLRARTGKGVSDAASWAMCRDRSLLSGYAVVLCTFPVSSVIVARYMDLLAGAVPMGLGGRPTLRKDASSSEPSVLAVGGPSQGCCHGFGRQSPGWPALGLIICNGIFSEGDGGSFCRPHRQQRQHNTWYSRFGVGPR